jgi:hypothetical protein
MSRANDADEFEKVCIASEKYILPLINPTLRRKASF